MPRSGWTSWASWPTADLPDFYACADVFALCCRSRWWGLEQEGFGIVLVEAAAAGVPCITIDSGGAGEAVQDGETGLVREVPSRTRATGGARGPRRNAPRSLKWPKPWPRCSATRSSPAAWGKRAGAGRKRSFLTTSWPSKLADCARGPR